VLRRFTEPVPLRPEAHPRFSPRLMEYARDAVTCKRGWTPEAAKRAAQEMGRGTIHSRHGDQPAESSWTVVIDQEPAPVVYLVVLRSGFEDIPRPRTGDPDPDIQAPS